MDRRERVAASSSASADFLRFGSIHVGLDLIHGREGPAKKDAAPISRGEKKHPSNGGGTLGVEITMKELLEAGVHFGHQTRRWNPKMKEYIFGERNGIHIIDLQKTLKMFRDAARYVSELAGQGKRVLFLGTKRQAQEAIAEEANRCGMFFVNHRWLGGTLTNWATLQKSIKRFKLLKGMVEDGRMAQFSKKEAARLERELKHLRQNFSGVENMTTLPDAMFVIDPNAEVIAVREARRMGIPVVAIVDTNCDPNLVDWVIPGNDDALRAIRLFTSKISDAVLSGRQSFEQTQIADQKSGEGAGEEGVDYVDTSAYEVYEKQEGDFVEPDAEIAIEPALEANAAAAGEEDTVAGAPRKS
jgi:small subunit ribosomal protein S2